MPTYEYVCTSCGHEWEFEQSIKDEPLRVCQKCNQDTARRQISRGVGFILKGGGWYADLYSSGSNTKEPAKEGAKEAPKTEGGSEAKPASGGESKKTETTSGSSSSPSSTPVQPAATA